MEKYMEQSLVALRIAKIIKAIESLIPEYLPNPLDFQIANGNVAVCIIDSQGDLYGKLFNGNGDRIRQREAFRVAWTKASQVWITGIKTYEYEKLVFSGQIDPGQFGINAPDFIGWEGGQPLALDSETTISVGFSGFRGTVDLEIAQRALKMTAE
jgi:uncharacterized protein GlcG (DUF336 family)